MWFVFVSFENLALEWDYFKWLLLVGMPIVYYFIWNNSEYVRLINTLPGPKPFPVIGNLLDIQIHDDGIGLYCSLYYV